MDATKIEAKARKAEKDGRYTKAVQLYGWAQEVARPLSEVWTRCRESRKRLGG